MTYVQGFVTPVPTAKKQAYIDMAVKTAPILTEYGAIRMVEAWGDDVPDGKTTDFKMAVKASANETVVFSWIEWPDKATYEAAGEKMRTDERMKFANDLPFDAGRMIFAGFAPILDTEK